MKKMISVCMAALMLSVFAGCSSTTSSSAPYGSGAEDSTSSAQSSQAEAGFDTSKDIAVISREDGSGTRSAFVELFGVEEEDADGNKVDMTSTEADVTNNTSVMMTSVAGNPYAIGYISMGSLDETVKAVKIDGAEASVENIKNGTYTISRPFNIATKAEVSEVTQDFINFIMSAEGQAVVEEEGYIPQETTASYEGNAPSGKIVVAGSSSVTPLMEKLKEAYEKANGGKITVEVQQSDSTTGITSAAEGICDIGMASRELKDEETKENLTATEIARDGIAVVVNNDNDIEELTSDQVKAIFTGETTDWEDLAK